jgi:glycogen debranching enzyme
MQGFVYAAKLHLSGVLWWLGRTDEARKLFEQASELKKRFNDAFWMPRERFFCMGLDPKKRQIRSIGSDPGHCLTSGIVDTSLAPAVAERMMSEELFTGWGIRTLSSEHPAFNPFSYHRGSVWPVENGAFALAFLRFGLHDKVERLCRAMFEAASLFDYYRLPEVFAGHQRDSAHPFPALYPRADWPQAWSASSVFNLLQSLLGLFPYAPLKTLVVNPKLPEWLPEITVHGLRLGQARATIRFYRKADGTSDWQLLDKRGAMHILQQPSPWSLTDDFAERTNDVLHSLLRSAA